MVSAGRVAAVRSGELYWPEVSGPAPNAPPLEGDATCEVAIIGGGISGALAARALVREGLDTILVDQGEFGLASSAANTGLLLHEIDKPLARLIELVGRDHAAHAYRRGLSAIHELEAIVATLPEPCGFRRVPTLYLASDARGDREVRDEHVCRREFGLPVQLLDGRQLADVSSIKAPSALWSHGNAQFNPYRFTTRVLQQALAGGLRGFANTRIHQVQRSNGGFELLAAKGNIRARRVVYAAGYAAGRFLGRHVGDLDTTYAAASERLTSTAGWPAQCLIWETARPYFYARQTDDGRAIIGGADTERPSDHKDEERIHRKVARLTKHFERLFPAIPYKPAYEWAGTFGTTRDGLPYLGQLSGRDNEYFILAYGGNGTTFSAIGAQLVADLIVGRANADAAVFRFDR
jgi:glycine/D-amino acid oxidase-like deaminating enzyme